MCGSVEECYGRGKVCGGRGRKSGGMWEGWRCVGEVDECGGRGKVSRGRGGGKFGRGSVGWGR